MRVHMFGCPRCGLRYQGRKERLPFIRAGRFDCIICNAEIHAWSGHFDYIAWECWAWPANAWWRSLLITRDALNGHDRARCRSWDRRRKSTSTDYLWPASGAGGRCPTFDISKR